IPVGLLESFDLLRRRQAQVRWDLRRPPVAGVLGPRTVVIDLRWRAIWGTARRYGDGALVRNLPRPMRLIIEGWRLERTWMEVVKFGWVHSCSALVGQAFQPDRALGCRQDGKPDLPDQEIKHPVQFFLIGR